MSKVSFKEMKKGTKKDYLLLDKHEKKFVEGTADRILKFMSTLTKTLEGYQISRLEHSLQTATRALKDGANDEMIVAALLHDIGDELAPLNHAEYAAAVLKPYVNEKTHWIVEKHGIFQTYYYVPNDVRNSTIEKFHAFLLSSGSFHLHKVLILPQQIQHDYERLVHLQYRVIKLQQSFHPQLYLVKL